MSDPVQKPAPWQPLPAIDRRVLGVLVEKAKTTPDQYPITLNGIVTGANQKSNRHPQMQIEADDAQESLDRLRTLGAVVEVQGGGRVAKFRHMIYDWLGVEKLEAAVMTELLLRGAQTEGELRGRAARMDPDNKLSDVAALRPVLESLRTKRLVVSLSPVGRGHVVTHNLYSPAEMERLRTEHAAAATTFDDSPPEVAPPRYATPAPASPVPALQSQALPAATADELFEELASLRAEVTQLRQDLESLANRFGG